MSRQEQGAVFSREAMQRLVERVVGRSRADGCQVTITAGVTGNIRFAANQLSTAGVVENATVEVESAFGRRHAAVSTNDLSDEALRRAVRASEALARLAPDDPEWLPELSPQRYVPVEAWFESTAQLSAADRAAAARTALDMARAAGDVEAAGFLVSRAGAQAIANKAGLFAYHRRTSANYTLTVRTSDGTGSGWAAADHPDVRRLDFAAVARRATEKARASREPVALEPGRYTVILEPQATGDLVQLMSFAMDARLADEGRSAFVGPGGGNRIGERIVDARVTLLSDPADADLRARPFDDQGLALGRQVWIADGVLRQLFYTRYWAQRHNRPPTGTPTCLRLEGGTQSLDELIASTERGVLVTRLWYLRSVDPRTILYTGLTRDGTFLIEGGRLARSVRNFRFNDSPLFLLSNLEGLGRTERIAGTEAGGHIAMPAVKARDFHFTSLSEAV